MNQPIAVPTRPTIFTFQNIPYLWGSKNPAQGLDCFGLLNYVLYTYTGKIIPDMDWIYQTYPHESDAPTNIAEIETKRLLGEKADGRGMALELVLLGWTREQFGLGCIIFDRGKKYVVHANTPQSRITEYSRISPIVRGVWDVLHSGIMVEVDKFC